MDVRSKQIASTLRHAVEASIRRGINDPRVRGLISVTNVEVAPDLSQAVISISVHPESAARLTLTGLKHAAAKIRAEVSGAMRLRRMPRIEFRLDESLKKLAAVERAISEASSQTPDLTTEGGKVRVSDEPQEPEALGE